MADVILKVENLRQYFKVRGGYFKAVDGVSFDVKKGEVLGVVGESGCGKTTIGRTIIGLNKPSGGNVYFNGQRIAAGEMMIKADIKRARADGNAELAAKLRNELRQARLDVKQANELRVLENGVKNSLITKIQMIFQDPVSSLNPRMTVREIIAEGLIIRGIKDKEYINQRVYDMLDLVGLVPEHGDRYPHEFSGGQRQRIGIARAIVMEPDLMIADEPVSALDVSIQAQVINLLNELRDKMGLTIVFIAHDLSVVKYFSDRIAVMYFGKMVELATADELFENPLHPYTKSLLSAIPVPDPNYEKQRKRIIYNPSTDHSYNESDPPQLRDIGNGHMVMCNSKEFEAFTAKAGEN